MKEKISVIVLCILMMLSASAFSGCLEGETAYIPPSILGGSWQENETAKEKGSRTFGLEKWVTLIYEKNGDYPGSLCVTSLKTLMLMDEKELLQGVKESVFEQAEEQGLEIVEDSISTGYRKTALSHQTKYFVCNASILVGAMENRSGETDNEGMMGGMLKNIFRGMADRIRQRLGVENLTEEVRIIGEVWNGGDSGMSVICMGMAVVTHHRPFGMRFDWNTASWRKIVADPYGTFSDPHSEGDEKVYGNDGLIYNIVCH